MIKKRKYFLMFHNKIWIICLSFFITFLFFYGSFQQALRVNIVKEKRDQSAYMRFAKEFYKARHFDKQKWFDFYKQQLRNIKNQYSFLSLEKRKLFFYGLIETIPEEFFRLSKSDQQKLESSLEKYLDRKDLLCKLEETEIVEILIKSQESLWGDSLDGNRMPLYPLIQSFFYKENMNDDVFFQIGKKNNIYLSFIILLSIAIIFAKKFDPFSTLNIILIITFTVFIFKAGFFQCETLFYFLSFISFLFYIKCFNDLNYTNSILAGIFNGLAYLTKASIFPALILFLFFLTLEIIFKKKNYKKIFLIIVIISSFFLTIYPLINENKKKFGSYFYNVNNSYFFKESWYQVILEQKYKIIEKTRVNLQSDDTLNLPFSRSFVRLIKGSFLLWTDIMRTYGYRKYIVLFLCFILYLVTLSFKYSLSSFKEYLFRNLFIISYFVIYYFLYAWYIPIAPGNRFVLSLLIPFLYVLMLISNNFFTVYRYKKKYNLQSYFNCLVVFILFFDIYLIISERILNIYGGN